MLIFQRAMENHGAKLKLVDCSLHASDRRKLSIYLISSETIKDIDAEMISDEGAVPLLTSQPFRNYLNCDAIGGQC